MPEEKSKSNNLEDIRDPRFFMSKVDDDSVEDFSQRHDTVAHYIKRGSNPSSGPDSELISSDN